MGMGGNGNGNGFMGMGGNGNRNSPSRTPLVERRERGRESDLVSGQCCTAATTLQIKSVTDTFNCCRYLTKLFP